MLEITVISEILKMAERGDIWKWHVSSNHIFVRSNVSIKSNELILGDNAAQTFSDYSEWTLNEIKAYSNGDMWSMQISLALRQHVNAYRNPRYPLFTAFSELGQFFRDSKQLVFPGHYVTVRKSTKHRDIFAHPFILNILSGVWPAATHKAEKHCSE